MFRFLPASSMPLASLSLALVVTAACFPEQQQGDRSPPRVLGVEPAASVVPVTTSFRVTLSEALDTASVQGDPTSETLSVALFPREQLSDALLSDFANPPITESRQGQVVPATVSVDGAAIVVAPNAALEPRTAYTLLVSESIRDVAQNPLVGATGLAETFRWDFSTDAGQPEITGTDLVSAGASLVAPNRRRIGVTFNQPVVGVTTSSLFFEGTPAPVVEAVLLDETRTSATILLAPLSSGCERLAPSTPYVLVGTDAIAGDTGQAMAPFRAEFTTGGACDTSPNTFAEAPLAIAGEVAATIRFETSKASTTEVRFGLVGGALDCDGGTCPVVGLPARQPRPGVSPPRFVHSVELGGLAVGNTYAFVVTAEDDVGQTASTSGTFVTAPLPKVGVNEVMANPPAGFTSENLGEYVELTNFGDVPVDVSGWALAVDGGDEGGGKTCALPENGTAPVLQPGAFLLLVGKDFDGSLYGGVDEAAVFRGANSTFCGALTNTRPQAIALLDADGRPISSQSAYASLTPDNDGRSIERTAPDAADVETSFCFSRRDAGPTPGRANGVVAAGCE